MVTNEHEPWLDPHLWNRAVVLDGEIVEPAHAITDSPHAEETAPMQPDPNRRVIAATVNLAYDDQSMTTIDIHEGAAIGVNLSQDTNHDEDAVARGGYRPAIISDRLRMELRASATQGGGEFVTITRTAPGENTFDEFEEWRVTGVPEAHPGPFELTWSPDRGDADAEGKARAFIGNTNESAWIDGPHLSRRTVTRTRWEPVTEP